MVIKLSAAVSDLLNVTILDVQTAAPTVAHDWSETDMIPAADVGLIPDCKWELKFSSVVDSICDGDSSTKLSFLSFTFD